MIKQRTIRRAVVIEGVGLHTGKKVTLALQGSPPGSGINFIRLDLPNKPLLNIQSLNLNDAASAAHERRTVLGMGPLQIQTTEHLLAAFSGLGIDNIVAELDNDELPGLDGSAKGFVDVIKKAGIEEQDAPKKFLKVKEPVWCRNEDRVIAILPDDNFRISYTMSYKNEALGTRYFDIIIDENSFEKEIAPARTFCLKSEALMLAAMGLGRGAGWKNNLIMGKKGPIGNKLRFRDEPVRHKVLDLMGDLYLAGAALKGHVISIKGGHNLNMEMVKILKGRI